MICLPSYSCGNVNIIVMEQENIQQKVPGLEGRYSQITFYSSNENVKHHVAKHGGSLIFCFQNLSKKHVIIKVKKTIVKCKLCNFPDEYSKSQPLSLSSAYGEQPCQISV